MRSAVLGVVMLLALSVPVSAQDAIPWGVMPIPGSPDLIAGMAGWPSASLERVRLARGLLKLVHGPGSISDDSDPLRRLLRTLWDIDDEFVRYRTEPDPRRFLRALGYDVVLKDGALADVSMRSDGESGYRRQILDALDVPVVEIVNQVLAGEPVEAELPVFEVPLPLGFDFWRGEIIDGNFRREELFELLLRHRQAALAYIGLTGLDPETSAVFAQEASVLQAALDHPIVFAEFSASIRVRSGRVLTPLGPDTAHVWESLVEASPDEPVKFIRNLLQLGEGRIAWFYDAVARYPPAIQRFALSTWRPPDRQLDEVWDTYEQFREFADKFTFLRQPFVRATFDPELALLFVKVSPSGVPAAPNSARFLRTALREPKIDVEVDDQLNARDESDTLGAAGFLRLLFDRRDQASRAFAQAYYFVQRVAAKRGDVSPTDVAIAFRGWVRFPALVQALERSTSGEPSVLNAAIRRAESLTRRTPSPSAHIALVQFQSTLELIRGMVTSGGISKSTADEWVMEVSRLEPNDRDRYLGAVLRWWRDELLPHLIAEMDAVSAGVDGIVLAALGGRSPDRVRPVFDWNGFTYVADRTAFDTERLEDIRFRQRVPILDVLFRFLAVVDGLSAAESSEAVASRADELEQLGDRLAQLVPVLVQDEADFDIDVTLRQQLRDLLRLKSGRDLGSTWLAENLSIVADWYGAYALLSVAYAAAFEDADDPLLAAGDVSYRHDLGTFRSHDDAREQIVWSAPTALVSLVLLRDCEAGGTWNPCRAHAIAASDVEWHIEGSILNLDTAVSQTPEIREGFPIPDPLTPADRAAVSTSARLSALDPSTRRDDAQLAADLIRDGRRRLAEAPTALASRVGWRYAAVPWMVQHEPQALSEMFTLTEILELGTGEWPRTLGSVGGVTSSLSGCVCLALVPPAHFEGLSERVGHGYLGALTSELRLRVAELLSREGLPASLMDTLYSLALRDVTAAVVAGDHGDWLAVAKALRSLTAEQLSRHLGFMTRARMVRLFDGGRQ